jgi:hypothetical protein
MGPDHAKRLADELHTLALKRDHAAVPVGPLVRWLAPSAEHWNLDRA